MRQTDPSQDVTPLTDPARSPTGIEVPGRPLRARLRRHLQHYRFLYLSIVAVLLLIFIPPLVNIGRYQRTIATSISRSLGRPVHLDRISLTLLPLPGFTIENLVVGEDPDFGSEPIIRANSVHATVRISSLWRRHVEFSTISFTEPSVNLVHKADGRWNIEGILLQASRIETAPTAQRHAGPAPRFPYIEASGARLNFKQEQEKLPFSLVDSDFALWLPDPHQWHLRLRAHPTRTDLNVSDTGTIELEAVLGAGPSLRQVALNLQGQWREAPLGEATRVLFGRDAGWRGNMSMAANIRGTFGESAVTTRLTLADARPADFVPEQLLNTQVECFATATGIFHALQDIRCSWPPSSSSQAAALTLTGSIPNIHHPDEASLNLRANDVPASTLMYGLRVLSPHVSSDAVATGTLSGSMTLGSLAGSGTPSAATTTTPNQWQGQFTVANAGLKAPLPQTHAASPLSTLSALEQAAAAAAEGRPTSATATLLSQDLHIRPADVALQSRAPAATTSKAASFVLSPVSLQLGGREPATLEGSFTASGYSLHLSGNVTAPRLQALAAAVPPVGDGLMKALPLDHPASDPFRIDLTASKRWRTPQVWTANATAAQPAGRARSRRHTR
ncbi:MAG TPA: AsmA family protein [Edaphobacter sp.]|nr:AsmA family protein [Edaphobacter sp.]